ncbi:MAG: helix-turn-helix transcriptional regulator, partial [Raoultibacter sp.]
KHASPVLVVGLGFLVVRLIPLGIQRSLALQLVSFFTVPSSSLVFVVITAVMVIIIGVFVVVFRFVLMSGSEARDSLREDVALVEAPEKPSREDVVQGIGKEAGLTPREVEIMGLVLAGNSQRKISEKLILSYGTVQWYMKAIYKKLDIHSKQDLVDLVQERLG